MLLPPIDELPHFDDAALWQAARATLTPAQRERSEELNTERANRPLAAAEEAEALALVNLYMETILVWAQATLLLKQHGYDISDPSEFAPVE